MDPQKIFGLITAGAAILAIAGVVIVYLRGSVADATIKQLKENFAAMKDARDIAKAQADEHEKTILAQQVKIEALSAQVNTLQEVVTNKSEVQAIAARLEIHHEESMVQLHRIEDKLP